MLVVSAASYGFDAVPHLCCSSHLAVNVNFAVPTALCFVCLHADMSHRVLLTPRCCCLCTCRLLR